VRAYVDATVLVALGTVGELDLLCHVPGRIAILPAVTDEVETDPEATNVDRFRERHDVTVPMPPAEQLERARDVLDRQRTDGDVALVAAVLDHVGDEDIVVLSDDTRVRNATGGMGATVSGTLGVLVYAVEAGELPPPDAKSLLERIDDEGLHTTGELRDRTRDLMDEGAREDP